MSYEQDTARRYRLHAEELRVIAEHDDHRPNKETLIKVARDYDRMAMSMETIDFTRQELSRS